MLTRLLLAGVFALSAVAAHAQSIPVDPRNTDMTDALPDPEPHSDVATAQSGVASYYGPRLTANGEEFDPSKMTAAHRTLPFGTMVKVTNLRNGRSVTVRINDRGPFVGKRVIDLTPAAAEALGFDGLAPVEISRPQ